MRRECRLPIAGGIFGSWSAYFWCILQSFWCNGQKFLKKSVWAYLSCGRGAATSSNGLLRLIRPATTTLSFGFWVNRLFRRCTRLTVIGVPAQHRVIGSSPRLSERSSRRRSPVVYIPGDDRRDSRPVYTPRWSSPRRSSVSLSDQLAIVPATIAPCIPPIVLVLTVSLRGNFLGLLVQMFFYKSNALPTTS